MSNEITHIAKVTIKKLWGYDDKNFEWNLNRDVNVLAGDNGSGKSTILKLIYDGLTGEQNQNRKWDPESILIEEQDIYFNNQDCSYLVVQNTTNKSETKNDHKRKAVTEKFFGEPPSHFGGSRGNANAVFVYAIPLKFNPNMACLISTFDQELKTQEAVQKLSNELVKTELDWQIHQLQDHYKDYQINIGKRAIEALTKGTNNVKQIDAKKQLFWDTLDDLFASTDKKIDRENNNIRFIKDKGKKEERVIEPYSLSSGEKQMLIILLTALVQDNQPAIMIMDEPEISLHTDWQENLIGNIRKLNENVQIIIATHSPSIIINGWHDKVFEIPDLLTPQLT